MNFEGTWRLQVATPFGTHPATLILERENDSFTGTIDSRLGVATLRDITGNGSGFAAIVSLELQGKVYEANIAGQAEGDQLDGTIKVKLPIAPTIKYSGYRDR